MSQFEFKTHTEDGTPVVLHLKPYGDAPGRISRRHVGQMERQVWLYLEWGLGEQDADILDSIPQREITKLYQEWMKASDDSEDDKPAKKAAPAKTIES